jgi:hypothetical protein
MYLKTFGYALTFFTQTPNQVDKLRNSRRAWVRLSRSNTRSGEGTQGAFIQAGSVNLFTRRKQSTRKNIPNDEIEQDNRAHQMLACRIDIQSRKDLNNNQLRRIEIVLEGRIA